MSVNSDEIAAGVKQGIANFLANFLLPIVVVVGIPILIVKVFASLGLAGSIVLVLAIASIAALCAVIWLWCSVWRSIANWIRDHEAKWPAVSAAARAEAVQTKSANQ